MLNNIDIKPKSIACTRTSTFVLMTDETIYGTGYNFYGQLGVAQDDNTDRTILTLMLNNTGKKPEYISCNARTTYILMSDNFLYGTGYNTEGQLGVNDNADRTVLTFITDSVSYMNDMSKVIYYYTLNGNTLASIDPTNLDTYDLSDLVITSIGDVFQGKPLSSITLPPNLESITSNAFQDCENLTSVTFPSTLKTIGDYAFENTSLSAITIPTNVTSIGEQAFSNCKLTKVTIQ